MLDLDIRALSAAYESGALRPTEVTEAALEKIEARRSLGAFISVSADLARRAAEASDARRGRRLGPLDGVPIAFKDNHLIEGTRTTAGSRMLEGYVAPYTATVVERLLAAGAVPIGKTNLDEFAMGSSNEHSAFGPARHPLDPERVPGGSSGGSAVAVADRQVPAALGSDTGGSIRQPAALTGIVGLKPTYGRVSRRGIVAYASSLDQVGPFARTVADAAILLSCIAGFDPKDSTSADRPVPDYLDGLDGGVVGMRIGVPSEYFGAGLDPEIEALVRAGIDRLAASGATVVPISLPHTEYAVAAYYLLATAEASSNLARYDGVRYGLRVPDEDLRAMIARSRDAGFGEEVKRRILLGTFVLSAGYHEAYYGKAQKVRTLIRDDLERAFAEVDLIATPTSPIPAFRIGELVEDPLAMYLADVCTLSVNLAGVPAISVPAGRTVAGLPAGLQLIAPWFEEARLLRAARATERD